MVYSLGGITHTPYSAEAQKPCAPAGGNLERGKGRYGVKPGKWNYTGYFGKSWNSSTNAYLR